MLVCVYVSHRVRRIGLSFSVESFKQAAFTNYIAQFAELHKIWHVNGMFNQLDTPSPTTKR